MSISLESLSSTKDPVETTVTVDYDRKVLMCWTCHQPTMKQWLKDFPEHCESNSYSVEMNTLPISQARKLKVVPKRVMSEQELQKRRELGMKLAKTRVNS
jgi:hypothetical protein